MFKITHFDKKLCHLLRHQLDCIDGSNCGLYSIWNLCPENYWKALKNFYSGQCICRTQYFAFIYWLVLIISIMGSVYSMYEFNRLFWDDGKQPTMWRQRTFYVLPPPVLRKCRLVSSLIMLLSWLLLSYAVVKVSPTHMTPWLTISTIVLVSELIIWTTEVLLGACKLELYTLFSFALAIINYLFVCCVQNVFQDAIQINDVQDLSLWNFFICRII